MTEAPVRPPRSETRNRILDVAMDLFVEHGVAGTTISEIERRVGLASGTGSLYRHFRSKEDVLEAAVEREVSRCLAAVERGRAKLPVLDDPREQLVREYEQLLRDVQRFERLFRLMLNEGDRIPGLRTSMAKALGFDYFEAEWALDPSVLVAVAAIGGYHFFGRMQGRPFQGVRRRDFIDALVDLTLPARQKQR